MMHYLASGPKVMSRASKAVELKFAFLVLKLVISGVLLQRTVTERGLFSGEVRGSVLPVPSSFMPQLISEASE